MAITATQPLLDVPQIQAWRQNVPGAMDTLTSALQNLSLNGAGGNDHVHIFKTTVVDRFNTQNPQFPKNIPHALKAFVDLTTYTLQESQKAAFEMKGRWLNSQNDLEIAQNQLTRTTTELTQVRGQLNALAQRMPSGRLLGTAAVTTFIAGALVTHFTPQFFPSWFSLGESSQNDCDDRLTQLHVEYQNMQQLGKDCLDQRKEVGAKLATCATLLEQSNNKLRKLNHN